MTGQGLFLVVSTFENDSIASVHKRCQFIDSLMRPALPADIVGGGKFPPVSALGKQLINIRAIEQEVAYIQTALLSLTKYCKIN